MLLKFVKENEKRKIVFGCDRCHRVIHDLSQAIFAWKVDRKTGAIPDGIIYVYHNNTCDIITLDNDNEDNPELWQWAPLSHFPMELISGLGISLEQVQEAFAEHETAE
jgi:hypothetical protein